MSDIGSAGVVVALSPSATSTTPDCMTSAAEKPSTQPRRNNAAAALLFLPTIANSENQFLCPGVLQRASSPASSGCADDDEGCRLGHVSAGSPERSTRPYIRHLPRGGWAYSRPPTLGGSGVWNYLSKAGDVTAGPPTLLAGFATSLPYLQRFAATSDSANLISFDRSSRTVLHLDGGRQSPEAHSRHFSGRICDMNYDIRLQFSCNQRMLSLSQQPSSAECNGSTLLRSARTDKLKAKQPSSVLGT